MRMIQKTNAPIKEWGVESGERHTREIVMSPTESVRENRASVDLRNGKVTTSVPGP